VLEEADDPAAKRQEILDSLESIRSPLRTAETFGIEEIIDPRDTRPLLCEWVREAYRIVPTMLGPSAHGLRP
jgi:hypothetical protein